MSDVDLSECQASIVASPHTDEYFVLIPPNVTIESLDATQNRLADLGLELMDEEECPSELLEDGTVRVWCAVIDGGA